ncbi:MAG: prepilin-type N-terminal cleavage/methylation domain-containing protein [Fimbriimonadaceae bacterium]
MRRAFTLIELLVVIAIIAILAAILFPVFSQAKEAAKKVTDLSNIKQTTLGVYQYITDADDTYPLGFSDVRGTLGVAWAWNYNQYFPVGDMVGPGSDGGYAARILSSPNAWVNSTQPYIKSNDLFAGPGMPAVSGGGTSLAELRAGASRKNVSYSYNGLLQSSSATAVASPSTLPMIWNGRGRAAVISGALSNPALYCLQSNQPCRYIPAAAGCSSANNGQQSAMFVLSGPMWVYGKGGNVGNADGSAKFRRFGAQLSPDNTDWRVDPYTGYNAQGFPGFYWWDGCHAWLFRPDYQP